MATQKLQNLNPPDRGWKTTLSLHVWVDGTKRDVCQTIAQKEFALFSEYVSCRLFEIVVGTFFLCGCVFLGDFFHTVSCSVWRCRFLTRLGTRNSGLPSFGAWGRENFSRPKNLNTRHHHRQPRQLPATPASPPPGNSRDLPLWPPTAPSSTLAAPPAVLVVVGGGCVNGRDGCNQTAINH